MSLENWQTGTVVPYCCRFFCFCFASCLDAVGTVSLTSTSMARFAELLSERLTRDQVMRAMAGTPDDYEL